MTLTACGGSGSSNNGGGGSQNQAPTSHAGDDSTVNEQSSVTLNGSGTDTDGTIASYQWSQTVGTQVTLSSPNSASTDFTAPTLIASEQLTFELMVTDNQGASASDSVTITVNPVNQAPVVDAGEDITTLTNATVLLQGSASDSDGQISQYEWVQTTGDQVYLTAGNTQTAAFTAPVAAQTLTFELHVTDNEGATATDTVNVIVEPSHNFALKDSQQQADQYPAGTELTWSVENYDAQINTLTWTITSTAPVQMSTLGDSLTHPNQIQFTTLELAQDTDVTIQVSITDNGATHQLSKTITMQAPQQGPRFAPVQHGTDTLAQISQMTQLEVMDVNYDGYNDIIHKNSGGINIAFGTATNTFTHQYFPSSVDPDEFYLADINGDGLVDILLTDSKKVSFLANNNNESTRFLFETVLTMPEDIEATQARVLDLDNDNDMDVAVIYRLSASNTPQLAWFEQNNGSFSAMAILDEQINDWDHDTVTPKMTIGDFNHDNKNDIMVATSSTNDARPVVLYTQTDSGVSKSTAFYLYGSNMFATYHTDNILTIDINNDGYDDVITWQSGSMFGNKNASSFYHINQKDGSFSSELLKFEWGENIFVTKGDIDGDGDIDVIQGVNNGVFACDIGCTTINAFAGHIVWIENLNGTFSSEYNYLTNNNHGNKVQLGDVDNDGDLDVIHADKSAYIAWIYENKLNWLAKTVLL